MHLRTRQLLILITLIAAFYMPSALLAQSPWQDIVGRGELVIATDATYPPFEATNSQHVIEGFDVELCAEIGKVLGIKTRFVSLEWAGVLPSLESGKSDLVMAGVTITPERRTKGYIFSRPYFLSGQVIAKKKGDATINSFADLKGKICSVQSQTTGEIALVKAGVPTDHILKFDILPDGVTDVHNGKSSAVVADLTPLKRLIKSQFKDLEIVGKIEVVENLGIVGWRGHEEVMSRVNYALAKLMVNGTYTRLYEKWLEEPFSLSDLATLEREKDAGSPVAIYNPAVAVKSTDNAPEATKIVLLKPSEIIGPLLIGARLTVILTLLTLVFGIPIGLLLALFSLSRLRPLKAVTMAYIELVRGTPLLLQIYMIYFVLPEINIKFNPFMSGVLALSLNAAAYIAEIFRAGIESIERGQMEAAKALGMNYTQAMRYVILPQAARRVLPPLTNEGVALLKDTSLVSVVALEETMRVGKQLVTNSSEPARIYLYVGVFYLCMTLPLTMLTRYLERRWKTESRG